MDSLIVCPWALGPLVPRHPWACTLLFILCGHGMAPTAGAGGQSRPKTEGKCCFVWKFAIWIHLSDTTCKGWLFDFLQWNTATYTVPLRIAAFRAKTGNGAWREVRYGNISRQGCAGARTEVGFGDGTGVGFGDGTGVGHGIWNGAMPDSGSVQIATSLEMSPGP